MPVYVYRCDDCGCQLEKRQSFNDAPLIACESCQGRLRRVLQPAVVIYKGSGFYSTDNSSKSGGNGRNGSSSNGSSSKDSSSNGSSETKPAEATTSSVGASKEQPAG